MDFDKIIVELKDFIEKKNIRIKTLEDNSQKKEEERKNLWREKEILKQENIVLNKKFNTLKDLFKDKEEKK